MTTIRRLILGAALTGAGIILTLTAGQEDAHAADKPLATLAHVTGIHDRIPGHRLDPKPDKPRKPKHEHRDEDPRGDEDQPLTPLLEQLDPEPNPEPEPADEPEAPADPPANPVVEVPPLDPPPIVVDPGVVDPVVIDVPPVAVPTPPAPPTATPPTSVPATPPTAAPAPQPAEPASAPLPGLGPVPAELPAAPTPAGPTAAAAALEVPHCHEREPAPADRGRGVVRAITDRHTGHPTASHPSRAADGCPGTPTGPDPAPLAQPSLKPPAESGAALIAIQAEQLAAYPTLFCLAVIRPRSHLPAGRATRIDPRPA